MKTAEVGNGEIGEITIRSRYLSPGYWRNEELTAARFTLDESTGVREFRGGDLGRWTTEGGLVFVDRKDAQVKVHGYRVELREIENAFLQQPEVEAAVVSARTTPDENIQITAHLVLSANHNVTPEVLRHSLGKSLPGYMVPGRLIFLDALPLTPHGKIDREKLRDIDPPATERPANEEVMTATEALVAGIWKKVLERSSVGRHDNFFALGGDSLNAGVVAAEISAALKVEIEHRVFNDHPTLAGLADAIGRLIMEGRAINSVRLERAPRDQPLPLSFRQEDLWKCSQDAHGMLAYTMACSLLVRGPLNVGVLRESMSCLVDHHEILRTTFDEVDGRLAQIVHPPEPMALPLFDFAGLADAEERAGEIFKKEASQLFDLKRMPLMRFTLVRIRENEHWLLRVNHHIVSDAWSWKNYFHELGKVYETKLGCEPLAPPKSEPLQYGDYAAHQRLVLGSKTRAYEETLDWWSRLHSEKLQPLKLPFQRLLRSRDALPADGLIWWGLDPATSERLEDIAREECATCYVVRLAALIALLADNASRHDVVLGTYVTGRNRVEFHDIMGDFSNQVMLRLRCDPGLTFREWLPTVRKTVGEAQLRGEIPYERVREEMLRRGTSPPDIRVIFTLSEHTAPVRFGGLEVLWHKRRMEGMPWGFCVAMDRHNEEHGCRVTFDARVYDPVRVRKWVGQFVRLLDAISKNPGLPVAKLLAMTK